MLWNGSGAMGVRVCARRGSGPYLLGGIVRWNKFSSPTVVSKRAGLIAVLSSSQIELPKKARQAAAKKKAQRFSLFVSVRSENRNSYDLSAESPTRTYVRLGRHILSSLRTRKEERRTKAAKRSGLRREGTDRSATKSSTFYRIKNQKPNPLILGLDCGIDGEGKQKGQWRESGERDVPPWTSTSANEGVRGG